MTNTVLPGWLNDEDVRPYVFMRNDLLISHPGQKPLQWFKSKTLVLNALLMKEVAFADQILKLEGKAFAKADMKMPRWVFYDCAIMPGFVCGFSYRTEKLLPSVKQILEVDLSLEWTPISLFIMIPSLVPGEWVAHNLCTMNSLVAESDQLYSLGFLTKAFGLWYANVEKLCGMTQWLSPAIRLHSHYGHFEILTAYTPVHSYAKTITYRSHVDMSHWGYFLNKSQMPSPTHLSLQYKEASFVVDPLSENSIIEFQRKIENKEGPFYFLSQDIRLQPLDQPIKVYKRSL